MSGNKKYRRGGLLQEFFPIDPTAKYDTFPEPGVAFEKSESIDHKSMDTYYYISDRKGNMKWIFPSTSRFPLFLTFHNDPTLRARFYKFFVNLAFRLRLKKLVVSGSLKLENTRFKLLSDVLEEIAYDDFALSSEQVEKSGKSVFAIGTKGEVTHFVKVAHTPEAEDEIENEMYALEILGQAFLMNLFHDSIAKFSMPNILVLANCKPRRARQSHSLKSEHIQSLVELYERYLHEFSIGDLLVYREINDRLISVEEQLSQVETTPLMWELFYMIRGCLEKIPTYLSIPVSFAHNDFTPWNIYKKSDKLHIGSWEAAKESMPVLHDLFHFIYQSGALLNWKRRKVNKEIEKALDNRLMNEFVHTNKVDIKLHHRMYLIYAGMTELKGYLENPGSSSYTQKRWQFWVETFRNELGLA